MTGPTTALLDSSVWVCYLRPSGWEELKAEVRRPLEEGRVATCWPVIAELLIGSRDDQAFSQAYANRAADYTLLNKLAEARRDAEQAVRFGFVPAVPAGDSDSPDSPR